MTSETTQGTIQLDKYARDARAWREFAEGDYMASSVLFRSENPLLWFAAATLGHHAVEMYLKAALICEGITIVDPRKMQELVREGTLTADECAWGHDLVALARTLEKKRPDFDLSVTIRMPVYFVRDAPLTLEGGLGIFNPFFSELRYPQELKTVDCLGQQEKIVLDQLVEHLRAFVSV